MQNGSRGTVARPLLPAPARLVAAGLAGACAVIIVVLGVLVAGQHQAGPVDARIDAAIQARIGVHARSVAAAVSLGDPLPSTIIGVVMAALCLAARRYRGLLLVAAVPVAIGLTEYALKPLFGRTLAGLLSYPSGHVTVVSALAVTAVVLFTGPSGPPLPAALRWLLAVGAIAAVAAVAVGVVAAGMHYATDAVGGGAVGTAVVVAAALLLDWLYDRRQAGLAPPGRDQGPAGMSGCRNERGRTPVAASMTSGHEITITPADARIEVTIGGEKLADSSRALVLAETGLPPRYYLPADDVRTDLLRPTSTHTTCPFKGEASYWSAEVGGEVHKDVVWSYPAPIPAAADIAGLLCFYTERVELTVDGAPQSGARASA